MGRMRRNRWFILLVLFLARMSMAFQFQAIAALSPLIVEDYGLVLADVGLLIGLYLAPGVVVAIPGGAVAARFGEKRVVTLSMCLMLLGGVLVSLSPDWNTLVLGRVLAGVGGVVLNVVMTKFLVDWFEGKEIATAMAIFVNSWPVGIALALVALPQAAAIGGLTAAWWLINGMIALGLLLFTLFYAPPSNAKPAAAEITVSKLPLYTLTLACLVWALYNTALSMVFSFGPSLFVQKGWALADAAGVTSAFMIVFSLALPFGGVLADRWQARDAVIVASLLGFAALIPVVLFGPSAFMLPSFLIASAAFALAAGPIMTLPAIVLSSQSRAFGMGVFFSIYYGAMMIGPRIVGGLADASGDISIAFICGVVLSLICVGALILFRLAVAKTASRPKTQ